MPRVDLLVVGGGTAGLVAAVGAANQGARVVLVERHRTGGDCLWTGCVPSKSLIEAANAAHTASHSRHLGVDSGSVTVDLAAVMDHVHGAVGALAHHDSPERLRREGVEVVTGDARFVGPDVVDVDGRELRFSRALIATGAGPAIPPIPGLEEVAPLTNEDLWELKRAPDPLVVLGGGPVGVELGQAFARLGVSVTLVELTDRLLPREEPEASEVVARQLRADGLAVRLGTRAMAVEVGEHGRHLAVTGPGGADRVPFDRLLVAVGRTPRTGSLGASAAGVRLDERGAVVVDARLRTSNHRIYAAGDVTLQLPFTHVAAAHGATVVQNALFGLRAEVDHDRIPWVTFSSPEVARVGLTVAEARRRFGPRIRVRTQPHSEVDRAVTAGATAGFARLVGDPKGRLVGATVVGPRAGETIGELTAWLVSGAKLGTIARTSTHAYPTWSEDVAGASLQELRVTLARLRPITRIALLLGRLLRR
jgi:pyruvate/2-oxoglutarate dehydrogenase complex dihydrolipoamide dehydrogenase (E3) component